MENSGYTLKAKPVGRYASTLEATWALHLRMLCDSVTYTGACRESFDFLVRSGDRDIALEVKPQLGEEHTEECSDDIPDIVYQAARRAYRKQTEQVCKNGLITTLIATGYPESARWYLVLCEADDRRYRHRHMRGSKRFCSDINTRSYSDYTIYVLDGVPEPGNSLIEWLALAIGVCEFTVDIYDPLPIEHWAQRHVSDKQKRKLANRLKQAHHGNCNAESSQG